MAKITENMKAIVDSLNDELDKNEKKHELLKKEFAMLDELNKYLVMLSEMDNIYIRRKIVLLEGFINKVKREIG